MLLNVIFRVKYVYIRYFSAYTNGKVPNWTWLNLKVLTQAIPHLNIFLGSGPVWPPQRFKVAHLRIFYIFISPTHSVLFGISLRQSSEPDLAHFNGLNPNCSPLKYFAGIRARLATTEVQCCPFTYFSYHLHIRYSSSYPYVKVPNRT